MNPVRYACRSPLAGTWDRYTRRSGPLDVLRRSSRRIRLPPGPRSTMAVPVVACSRLRKLPARRACRPGGEDWPADALGLVSPAGAVWMTPGTGSLTAWLRKSFCGWNHARTKMISPAPMTAAAPMTGCLRASRLVGQRLPGRPPRPGSLSFSAISGSPGGLMPGGRRDVRLRGGARRRMVRCARGPVRAAPSRFGIVGEAECPPGRLLHRDHEAHAIGAAAGEGRAGVLEGDRVHVAAALVGTYLHHPALDSGHAVRIDHVRHRQGDPGIAAHVFRLPDRIGGAHEDVLVLKPHPHHPVAR